MPSALAGRTLQGQRLNGAICRRHG